MRQTYVKCDQCDAYGALRAGDMLRRTDFFDEVPDGWFVFLRKTDIGSPVETHWLFHSIKCVQEHLLEESWQPAQT